MLQTSDLTFRPGKVHLQHPMKGSDHYLFQKSENQSIPAVFENSCAGVLHSCKDVPHRLVQEAAEKCVEANACKYSYFKKVLSMVQNNHSSSAINGTGKLPSHTNIRGKEAYK